MNDQQDSSRPVPARPPGRGLRRTALFVATALVASVLVLAAAPAQACEGDYCPSGSGPGNGSSTGPRGSSPTQIGSTNNCVAYANGGGMGSYCATGGVALKTLRERFGKTTFQMCRFTTPPDGLPVPFNNKPDQGKWWLRTCLTHVDFDTYSGGPDRRLNIGLVWVPNDFDTTYHDTALSNFLWKQFERTAQFPVPFVQTRPNLVPLVGYPTFFTFRWIDPKTKNPVSQGEYADNPNGGPFVQLRNEGGLVMQARARKIVVSPEQSDMKAVDCGAENPTYNTHVGTDPKRQSSKCQITFDRSSATSREKTTQTIPKSLGDVYATSVTVTWEVRYGPDENHLQQLGDGFKMVLIQPLPVQEIQAPNQPPVAIY